MINEGAKILAEGKAQRASDIDIVWITGYGWPVYRGGPMFYADTVGLEDGAREAEGVRGQVRRGLQARAAARDARGGGRLVFEGVKTVPRSHPAPCARSPEGGERNELGDRHSFPLRGKVARRRRDG